MDKQLVVRTLIAALEAKLKRMDESIESTRQQARDAPGANVSHSDTSKYQLGNVALGLSAERQTIHAAIADLRGLPVDRVFQAGAAGALVLLRDPQGAERTYLLVMKGGGETVEVDGRSVASLSMGAPLGRACLKKEVRDELTVNGKTYEVANIW